MPRLTLRTLLAYIDDTLEPAQARSLGRKVAESEEARQLIERIKRVTRRRGLRTPLPDGSDDDVSDPNTVAAYLSDNLDSDQLKQIESTCLESDVHLAEVAACHQILTLVLTEPVRVPPTANQRMYQLVDPPASDYNRKPGNTIPVGAPPRQDQPEVDDPDAAFLLGMQRYTATNSWSGRLKLMGTVTGLALFLLLAVLMALPHGVAEPVQTSRGEEFAAAPAIAVPSATPPTPSATLPAPKTPAPAPAKTEPKATAPAKGPTEVAPEPKAAPMPKEEPKGELVPLPNDPAIPRPLPGTADIGKFEGTNTIVLTREDKPGTHWTRLDPDEKVAAASQIMALPGYKAKIKLPGMVMLLWGNLPEQIPMKAMVMQSQVRFNTAPPGFDADFNVIEGRVYVSAIKPTGAKFRVRFGPEVWDVELPNEKSEVMLQSHTSFVPGTPFPQGGKGGEPPRTEAMMVVVRGTANIQALGRFKKFADIPQWDIVAWESKTNSILPPSPVNRQGVVPEPDTFIPGEIGKVIQGVLSDAAASLKDKNGVRPLLESRITTDNVPESNLTRMLSTYAYAAIADAATGEEAKKIVGNLYDILKDSERMLLRQSAVMAVSAWIGRSPEHTELLTNVLTTDKLLAVEEANLIAQLLRGYSSAVDGPTANDPSKIFDLVRFLDSKLIVVREAALGNLLGFYEIPAEAAGGVKGTLRDIGSSLIADVGTRGPKYGEFLKAWDARAEEIKNWMESRQAKKAEKK